MKDFLGKYQRIVVSIIATLTLVSIVMGGTWKLVEWRIEKSSTICGIRRELVFLNCLFRVSLTKKQQEEAEELFKSVDGVGKR